LSHRILVAFEINQSSPHDLTGRLLHVDLEI